MSNTQKQVSYPFMHPDGEIEYVTLDNEFMQAAKEVAYKQSLDDAMPTGTVIVKNGKIIGRGANGSNYHKEHGCERVRRGIPTGQGYELCEGCSPKNHSEPQAIANARANGKDPSGAEAYLWGHWWCCEPCWTALTEAGITKMHLLEDSEHLFNKESPDNIVGRQFEHMAAAKFQKEEI